MKIEGSRAAAWRYVVRKDRFGPRPEVPDKLGPVHAVLLPTLDSGHRNELEKKYHGPLFLEWSSEESACGRHVRLVFPVPFDTAEDDSCPDCLVMVELWVNDRDQYDRRVIEREQRRTDARQREWERREEREIYEEFQRRQAKERGDDPESPLDG